MNDNFNTDLYQDWKMTAEKEEMISELENRVSKEKDMMPELLSRYDLKERWNMNSRQSVHNIIKRPNFPKPVYRFSNGRYPVYLKAEIEIFELKYPMILTQESREKYSNWIAKKIIFSDT